MSEGPQSLRGGEMSPQEASLVQCSRTGNSNSTFHLKGSELLRVKRLDSHCARVLFVQSFSLSVAMPIG